MHGFCRWSGQVRRFSFRCTSEAQGLSAQSLFRLVRSGHRARAMSFSEEEVLGALRKIPSDSFLAESAEVKAKWLHFVASGDADPRNLHDVMFYAIVARTLAEVMGSDQPADYAEPHMRSLIGDGIKVGAVPFEKKSEDVTGRSVKVQPAHATLPLRVQAKAAAQHAPPSASAILGDNALAQAMQQYVQTQQTELDKGRKKGTLSYDLKARFRKVGLSGLPDFPTADAMIRLKSASMAAHAQGRQYVSSAEARSPSEFRPSWTRTPAIDVLVGNGSLEENIHGALDARKQRSQQDRVDYLSYANFQGHVLDWGVKMVVTKVLDPVHLIGYQLILSRVAEEFGGASTAYYYDLLLRQKLAKELENGAVSVHGFLMHLNRDILDDAKANVESSAKCGRTVIWRKCYGLQSGPPAAKNGKEAQKSGAGKSSNGACHQISGANVVPVHARRDDPTTTSNRRKMFGIKKKNRPSRATRGVPSVGKAVYHHHRQWIGGAPRMV